MTDYLDKKLCETYENEAIFDKFDLSINSKGTLALTGAYDGDAHIINTTN